MILFGNQQNRSTLVTYGNGLLYNWYAVSQANFAPAGWHVPTQAEFNTVATYLGGASVAGGKMKSTRTGLNPGWNSPNTGADGELGFKAFGAGRRINDGTFGLIYNYTYFWSLPQTGGTTANAYYNAFNSDDLFITSYLKIYGFSTRLIKDDSIWYPGMTVTDLDGNKYATVKIGNQVWLKSNWKCTKYNDGTPIPNVTNGNAWSNLTTGAYCSYNNQPIVEYFEKFPL